MVTFKIQKTIFIFSILLATKVFATADGMFANGATKAMVLVNSRGQDQDGLELFKKMNVPAQNAGTFQQKKISFAGDRGEKYFDLLCRASMQVQVLQSCALTVYAGPDTKIDNQAKTLIYKNTNKQQLDELKALFVLDKDTKLNGKYDVFVSSDSKFFMTFEFDQQSSAISYEITYN